MKRNILFLLFLFLNSLAFSQAYMDTIVLASCECLRSVPDSLATEEFNMKLGICIIESASSYQAELLRDYQIDFAKIDIQGEDLGRIIGMKMATVCPEDLVKVTNRNSAEEPEVVNLTVEGQVIGIEEEKFVNFAVKDDVGKVSKYYWLTFVGSNVELTTNYKSLKDKFVRITFISQEFFDARIGEYRNFNVIHKIETLDEEGQLGDKE